MEANSDHHCSVVPESDNMYFVLRTETFAKLFFTISLLGLLLYLVLAFYTFHTAYISMSELKKVQQKIRALPDPDDELYKDGKSQMKHILLWSVGNSKNSFDDPISIGEGQDPFINQDCLHKNCYITKDKKYLAEVSDFDAVVFDVLDLKRWNKSELPLKRSPRQKYVFFGKSSAYDAPVCHRQADDFFNWTWSYKLYSDIFSPFIEVKNLRGEVVAPRIDIDWRPKIALDPIVEIDPIKPRKKAMVWISKKCGNPSCTTKMELARIIQALMVRENLIFDIYGHQGKPCPDEDCLKTITNGSYYFYWAYEGAPSEDYVTDEVMNAIDAGTVPILFGGADYSKFLPPGSFINGRFILPENLAAIITYAIKNPKVYRAFFRWKQHYTISRAHPYKGLCQLCSFLNNQRLVETYTHYEMFRRWWYPGPLSERCLAKHTANVSDLFPNSRF